MTVIYIALTLFLIGISIIINYHWIRLKAYNQSPLDIETFDGFNSPFHPSVLYFPNSWNGWKYWMAETPFSPKCKPYVDRNECPSIHLSNDGITWTIPEGLTNPLVNFGKEGELNLDYYSDPHLVMVGNRMECWYRLTQRYGDANNRDKVSLRRIFSYNGKIWSEEEIISELWKCDKNKGLGNMVVSPALIYSADKGYTMWYVNSEDHYGIREIAVSTSINGKQWSNATICTLSKKEINPWHIDVMKDIDGNLLMTIYDKKDLTLWNSTDGINWNFITTLLSPSNIIGSFYCNGLYRSSLVHDNENYKLYFSAYDHKNTYIGLCTFDSPGDIPLMLSIGKNNTIYMFVFIFLKYKYKCVSFVLKKYFKKLSSPMNVMAY